MDDINFIDPRLDVPDEIPEQTPEQLPGQLPGQPAEQSPEESVDQLPEQLTTLPYKTQSLELVLNKVIGQMGNPVMADQRLRRDKTNEDIDIHIRSLPWEVWDTIKYVSFSYKGLNSLKSISEGCMIHCGLAVIEKVLSKSSKTRQTWLDAYVKGDSDTALSFTRTRFSPEYLGKGIGQTRKLFFLNKEDGARAMEISTTYGFSASEVVTLALIAAMAMSEWLIPRQYVDLAIKEIKRFEKEWS